MRIVGEFSELVFTDFLKLISETVCKVRFLIERLRPEPYTGWSGAELPPRGFAMSLWSVELFAEGEMGAFE